MIIVGEKLNSSKPETLAAMNRKDNDYITELITLQSKAGADFLDINTALCEDEAGKLLWISDLVQKNSNCGIMIDSPCAKTIEIVLQHLINVPVIINSVTLDEKIELVYLAAKKSAGIVGLPIDKNGVPKAVQERVEKSEKLVFMLREAGIPDKDIYIDILVQSLSASYDSGKSAIEALKSLSFKYPKINTICGISNISFGLPKREELNAAYLTIAAYNGLTAAIFDNTSQKMRLALKAAEAISGKDEYCLNYLNEAK